MRIDEIESRLSAIATELDQEGADIDALTEEVDSLTEERNAIKATAEKRDQLRKKVSAGAGITTRKLGDLGEAKPEERTYNAESPEYRTAWLKNMAVSSDGPQFGALTEEERRAFTFTTANTGSVVPKATLNRIVELVRSQYPIYMDSTKVSIQTGFGVPRHKAINAGDAAQTAEGVANTDEQDTFDLLDIANVEIKKSIEQSRKMKFASIDAFEDWIVSHISKRMAVAKEKYIITQLDNSTYGIDSGNAAMTGTLSDEEIRKVFAAIDQDGQKVVYANAKTIWTIIAGLENAQGQKLFIPSTMEDALVSGRIYGAPVKVDANIPDNEMYIGVPTSILSNEASEYELFSSIEPKTVKSIYTGFSLFGAGLENPKAFVKYTHSPA